MEDPATVRPMTRTSADVSSCASPAGGVVGAFTVSVSCNGVVNEPYHLGAVQFAQYDLSAVAIIAAEPPGVPVGATPTPALLRGVGFSGSYGALVARVSFNSGAPTDLPARYFSPTTVGVTLPAFESTGEVSIALSLNNGTDGTFTSAHTMRVYTQPTLESIEPVSGGALGGTLVTITGTGFDALGKLDALRCRFRDAVQTQTPPGATPPTAVVSYTDTQVLHAIVMSV